MMVDDPLDFHPALYAIPLFRHRATRDIMIDEEDGRSVRVDGVDVVQCHEVICGNPGLGEEVC
jgi:hypothetical protein